MSKNKARERPLLGAVIALREIPANTSWLLHKAIRPLPTEEAGRRFNDLGVRVSEATHSAADKAIASSSRGQSVVSLTGDALKTLPKTDLLRVAQELNVASPTTMKKSELVRTLVKEGVSPDQLTKRELISLGETRGLDVRSSMSKAELVTVIGSHINS